MPEATRQAALTQMASQLLHAAKAQDWAALEMVDRNLADVLPQLAAHGAWSAAERASLQALSQAHEAARTAATAAGHALAERIAQMQSGRDGWLAYAMHSEHESESTHP